MKIFAVLAVVISVSCAAKIKCNTMKDDKLVEGECADGIAVCKSPMFAEYTGIDTTIYGCGPCATGTKDVSCKECTGTAGEAPCNKDIIKAPADAKEFECFDHTFDATATKWAAGKTAGKCHAKKDTAVKCNSPTATATKEYAMMKKGCGPCDAAALKDKTCAECTTTKCNSASTLAYALIPLLAVIFHAL